MHREFSPLVKAEDAVEIDTSDLTIEEVCDKIYHLAEPYLSMQEKES